MSGLVAALLVALAVLLGWDSPEHRLTARLAGRPSEPAERSDHRRGTRAVLALGIVVVCGVVGGQSGVVLGLLGAVVAATASVLRGRATRRRHETQARARVVEAGEALAGLLRVGSIPATALASAAEQHPVLSEAAALQAVGGEVVAALRRSASGPGREGLRDLAAAWEVAQRTGASMSDSIEAVADELGRREEAAATVRVELSASRAASRLMAGLPAVGVAMGYGFGGDPLAFLTQNVFGEVCLLVAAGLAATGLLWTDVLAERAAR